MKLTLDAKGLAEALSLPVRTVQQYASRYPERLPPRLNLPSRKLMWAVADVQDWIERHRAASQQAPQQ
jgi:predicted DNA-binding transcriptional regulator AlpA